MPPRRAALGLIPDPRARSEAFTKRTKELKKKAKELSVLCDVDVALVVAAAGADAAAADPWESREGVVLARYRALPPETRARHTHRAYLDGELGKEAATLARVRQAGPVALRQRDGELGGVAATEGDARRMLDALDAAIRAADERRTALGLPVDDDDGGVLEGIAPLGFAAGIDHGPAGGNGGDTGDQLVCGNVNDGGFHFQPCCGGADMQTGGYGFEQCTTTNSVDMEGYHLEMAPAMYGSSSHLADAYPYQLLGHAQPNLSSVWSGDEPCHVMVPAEYPFTADDSGLSYNHMVDTQANASSASNFAMGASGNVINSTPDLSLAMATGGGNFIKAPPAAADLSYTLGGIDDNFTITNVTPAQPLSMSYGADLTNAGWYAAQWQAAPEPQSDDTGREPIEQPHYFSDMEDTQLHL